MMTSNNGIIVPCPARSTLEYQKHPKTNEEIEVIRTIEAAKKLSLDNILNQIKKIRRIRLIMKKIIPKVASNELGVRTFLFSILTYFKITNKCSHKIRHAVL